MVKTWYVNNVATVSSHDGCRSLNVVLWRCDQIISFVSKNSNVIVLTQEKRIIIFAPIEMTQWSIKCWQISYVERVITAITFHGGFMMIRLNI